MAAAHPVVVTGSGGVMASYRRARSAVSATRVSRVKKNAIRPSELASPRNVTSCAPETFDVATSGPASAA